MTPRDLIKGALRAYGAIATGQTPSAALMKDCLESLNLMLKAWSARRLFIYHTEWENFTLTAGTASYTIGSGGDFDTTRPNKIQGAFIRDDGGTDHPVDVIGEDRYRRLTLKSNQTRPDRLHYDPNYPLGKIYLYPTPADAEALHLFSLKTLTTFTSLSATIQVPGEYEEALKFNLAVRLAPEDGMTVSQDVKDLAKDGRDTIRRINAANQVESIPLDDPILNPGGRRYNINTG